LLRPIAIELLPLVKIASARAATTSSSTSILQAFQNRIERLGLYENFPRGRLTRATTPKSLVIPPHGIQNELLSGHFRIFPSPINNLDTAIALIKPRQRISWSVFTLPWGSDPMERTFESIGGEMHEHIADVADDRRD
jgi:hypothetical protein